MDAATTPKPLKIPPKISVKIWRPIIDKLDAKLDAACLRRDAYLAKLLATELHHLDAEVSLPNSPAAHDFTLERLDACDRKLVSIALAPALAGRLAAICTRKRIVRDAFFNRIFLLLAVSPKTIDTLFFPDEPKWRTAVWSEFKHDGPFFESGFYPLEAPVDPFWAIRAGLELFNDGAGAEDYEVPIRFRSLDFNEHLAYVHTRVDQRPCHSGVRSIRRHSPRNCCRSSAERGTPSLEQRQ
jgi:hypothetical protein